MTFCCFRLLFAHTSFIMKKQTRVFSIFFTSFGTQSLYFFNSLLWRIDFYETQTQPYEWQLFQLTGLYSGLRRLCGGPGQHLDVSLPAWPVRRRGLSAAVPGLCRAVRLCGPFLRVRHRPHGAHRHPGRLPPVLEHPRQREAGRRAGLDSAAWLHGHCHWLFHHHRLGAAQPVGQHQRQPVCLGRRRVLCPGHHRLRQPGLASSGGGHHRAGAAFRRGHHD